MPLVTCIGAMPMNSSMSNLALFVHFLRCQRISVDDIDGAISRQAMTT